MDKKVKILTTNEKFKFECKSCNECCTGDQTTIHLSPYDSINISKHLNIEPETFLKTYCNEKVSNDVPFFFLKIPCPFLKEKCMIYEVRPTGCRTFPIGTATIIKDDKHLLRYVLHKCKGYNKGKETCLDDFIKKSKEREEFDKEWVPLRDQLFILLRKDKIERDEYKRLFLKDPIKKAQKLIERNS